MKHKDEKKTFFCWTDPRGAALAIADEKLPLGGVWLPVIGSTTQEAAMRFVASTLIGKRSPGSVVVLLLRDGARASANTRYVVEIQKDSAEFWRRFEHVDGYEWPLGQPCWINLYCYMRCAESRVPSSTSSELRGAVAKLLETALATLAAEPDVGNVLPADTLLRKLLTKKNAMFWEAVSHVSSSSAGGSLKVPYRYGLPPLRLRKVLTRWENGHALDDGSIQVVEFSRVGASDEMIYASGWPDALLVSDCDFSSGRYRPHGKTWEEVETLADASEEDKRST